MSSIFSNIETAMNMNSESISEKTKLVQRVVPRKPVKWYTAKECHPFVQDLLQKQKGETNDKKSEEEIEEDTQTTTPGPGLRGRRTSPICPPKAPQKVS